MEEKAKKTRTREPAGKSAKTSQGKRGGGRRKRVNIILKTSNSYVILLFNIEQIDFFWKIFIVITK